MSQFTLCRLEVLNIAHQKRYLIRSIPGMLTKSMLLFLVVGCATPAVKDNLQPGIPKCFVEFYLFDPAVPIDFIPNIYSIHGNTTVYEGWPRSPIFSRGQAKLRLAKAPGTYVFKVSCGTFTKDVDVLVEDRKITPVRISVHDIDYRKEFIPSTGKHVSRGIFKMFVFVEDSMPVE